jgi:hypothetical protein
MIRARVIGDKIVTDFEERLNKELSNLDERNFKFIDLKTSSTVPDTLSDDSYIYAIILYDDGEI